MKGTYTWTSNSKNKCKYHFVDGIFDKFTIDGVTQNDMNDQYKGEVLTNTFKENLNRCGFYNIT